MSEEKVDNEFGDFEEVKDENQDSSEQGEQQGPVRVRLPREPELLGVILQRYGGNRMEVHCSDGKARNCRVPGRYRRRLWLRPKDVVIIVPWEDDDNKGDVIFKYRKGQDRQLRKRNLLDFASDDF